MDNLITKKISDFPLTSDPSGVDLIPTVHVEADGTKLNRNISFETIANAAKGDKGPQGIQGIQGIPGEKGKTGDSAYEDWLNLGNTGTEQDFIDSLKGDKGDAFDTAPSTATSTGVAGQTAYDANYFYVCTATNTWKRTALSTW